MTDTEGADLRSRGLARVQAAAADVQRKTADLNAAIRQARDNGCSLREIADAAGLTHQTISNRLKETQT
jgi:IS30 family transposase